MIIEQQRQSDELLIEAALAGHVDSFGALYQRYHNPIVALAYARLRDKHAAEDAAQEVFAIACRDLWSLRSRDKFGAWLGGICRNVTRQMLRERSRAEGPTADPPNRTQPGQQEQWDAVRRAVWNLPEADRELIVMRYFDGFSQAKISAVLGISPSAVNGRLVRAKRKVAELLKRDGFGS